MNFDISAAAGETVETPIGKLKIIYFLGKGKSGYSYLAKRGEEPFVLKLMHYEEVSCYSFDDANKVDLEAEAYRTLISLGISVPRLHLSVPEEHYLIKEFIDGPVATDFIKGELLSPAILKQLFEMSSRLESKGINIDYFPNNFVLNGDKLYYIDYEINTYKEDWNLENWGIWYWANSRGMKLFGETGDASHINADPDKGLPHKDPFRAIIEEWIETYSSVKK